MARKGVRGLHAIWGIWWWLLLTHKPKKIKINTDNHDVDDWRKVIFSDETEICINCSNNTHEKKYIYRLNYQYQKIWQTLARDIRNQGTAVSTLLGLINSVYRDLRHWRSDHRPQNAEPKVLSLSYRSTSYASEATLSSHGHRNMENKETRRHIALMLQRHILLEHTDRWIMSCIIPFPEKDDLGIAMNYWSITLTSIDVHYFLTI